MAGKSTTQVMQSRGCPARFCFSFARTCKELKVNGCDLISGQVLWKVPGTVVYICSKRRLKALRNFFTFLSPPAVERWLIASFKASLAMRVVVQFCNSTIVVFIKTPLNWKKLEALTRTEVSCEVFSNIYKKEKNKHKTKLRFKSWQWHIKHVLMLSRDADLKNVQNFVYFSNFRHFTWLRCTFLVVQVQFGGSFNKIPGNFRKTVKESPPIQCTAFPRNEQCF